MSQAFYKFHPVKRNAVCFTLASFCLWSAWDLCRIHTHAFGDLSNGTYTDHLSHMNAARVFFHVGIDLWRKPISALFPELTPAEQENIPLDVQISPSGGIYKVTGWPLQKPLAIGWSHRPRNYPPGDMVLFSPVALLYHYTTISAKWANRLAILLCIVFTHVTLYLFIYTYSQFGIQNGSIGLIGLIIVYSTSIYWSLQGFYDLAAATPLLICGRYIALRNGLNAVLAYCVSAAIHYRAFMLAPLVIWGLTIIVLNRQWQTWSGSEWMKCALASVLAFSSLCPFWFLWPAIANAPINNISNVWSNSSHWSVLVSLEIVSAIGSLCFAWQGAWLDVTILAWFTFMIMNLREIYPWHVLIPIAWLGIPVIAAKSVDTLHTSIVRDVRLALLLFISIAIFNNKLVPNWLGLLFPDSGL